MSRRRVLSKMTPVVIPPASDIALYDKTTGKEMVIQALSYNTNDYPANRYTPIGVVVIPKEHSLVLYPEGHDCYGKDIIMSLKCMRYDTPDTGGADQRMHWGNPNTDLTLPNYSKFAVVARLKKNQPRATTNTSSCRRQRLAASSLRLRRRHIIPNHHIVRRHIFGRMANGVLIPHSIIALRLVCRPTGTARETPR